jgi:hypothetical protein
VTEFDEKNVMLIVKRQVASMHEDTKWLIEDMTVVETRITDERKIEQWTQHMVKARGCCVTQNVVFCDAFDRRVSSLDLHSRSLHAK